MLLTAYSRVATNLENLEKSGNLTMVREKSGKVNKLREKSGKMCFACGLLPQLRWSNNKHCLTA